MKKKVLFAVLAGVMAATMIPAAAVMADEEKTV